MNTILRNTLDQLLFYIAHNGKKGLSEWGKEQKNKNKKPTVHDPSYDKQDQEKPISSYHVPASFQLVKKTK